MTWLDGDERQKRSARVRPGHRLRALLERPAILRVPGAHNALAGVLAKEAGFDALYISGGALTASLGLPDLGVMTMEELTAIVRQVARATDLPLIVDGDTGYGGALNAMRLVTELENAGAAAVQIEDQQLPKKCGHLNDKCLVPVEEAAAKITAAKKAATDLVVIARTDAAGVDGLDAAIGRAKAYTDAGADVVFADGLASRAEFETFAAALPGPKMANMTEFGRTPHFTGQAFQEMGYAIVIWPATSVRVAAKAMQALYAHLRDHDGTEAFLDRALTRAEQYDLLGYYDYEDLDGTLARSVVPDADD